MVTTVFYEKVGRRYVPVSEYNNEFVDSFKKGTHIVMCFPGGQSRRYNIEPDYAGLIAAGRVAEDRMCDAMRKASEMRPRRKELTVEQQRAWNRLNKAMGDDVYSIEIASAREIAEAGLKAMQEEAQQLLTNPAVKLAYEQFLLVCELTKKTS
jgi:hypothetical protein